MDLGLCMFRCLCGKVRGKMKFGPNASPDKLESGRVYEMLSLLPRPVFILRDSLCEFCLSGSERYAINRSINHGSLF